MENINVRDIAALARLSFSEEEETKMMGYMKSVEELCSVLDDIDCEERPCNYSVGELREDDPVSFPDSDKIISEAPSVSGAYVSVPRTVGGDE